MRLLAFETATEACSVALHLDGEVHARHAVAPRRHAELVLPWAEALLDEAGVARSTLDAVACGRGPGAFTGVRLAIALTQGIALALDLPVVGVSTLAALAQQAPAEAERIVAAIDARMGEVYLGAFTRDAQGLVIADGGELLGPPDAVALPPGAWAAVGTGFAAREGTLARRATAATSIDASALPHATAVARLAARAWSAGEAIAPERLEPAYLRDKVALTLAEQRKARG